MSHADDVQRYIDGVLDGSIVTGRLVRLAVCRHVEDLEHGSERGIYFDPEIAEESIAFADVCIQYEGEWAGLPLELLPHQKFMVWCLMGWRQKSDGMRRFRKAHIEMARKGGKSSMCAYLCCLLLLFDSPIEQGAQGYCAATMKPQAAIVWRQAVRMIEASPSLKNLCKVTESVYNVAVPRFNSFFRPIASDGKRADGFNPHFIIRDELHEWGEKHRQLVDTLDSGFGARRQPLTITITTAGTDRSLIWQEDHNFGVRVLESVITGDIVDDAWFVFIAAIDYPQPAPCFRCQGPECAWCDGSGVIPADDPFDESCWIKANPGIGITPKLERMRESANEAQKRREKQNEFLRKNCNVRVSSTERLIMPEVWEACRGDLGDTLGLSGHGGFDLGRSNDFASIAALLMRPLVDDDGKEVTQYLIKSRSFTCKDRHHDVQTNQIQRWVQDGYLTEHPGDAVDFNEIQRLIVEFSTEHTIRTWAYDDNFAKQMAQSLLNDHGCEIFPFTQIPKYYNEPISKFCELLTKRYVVGGVSVPAIIHNGCPVLAWQAGNLIAKANARGEKMPDKGSSKFKIDAMVSILMAFSECLFGQKTDTYEFVPGSLAL